MKKLCVAIIGGIGSGKSTAASYFKQLGANVISADQISKDLTSKITIKNKLKSMFGSEIFDEHFNLKRKVLADVIFNNFQKKKLLEDLLHPLVRQQIIKDIKNTTETYCIIEIPVLNNLDNYKYIDRVLWINTSPTNQIKHTSQRDNASKEAIKNIVAQQINSKQRLALADDVIENNSNLKELQEQCLKLHTNYINQSLHNA